MGRSHKSHAKKKRAIEEKIKEHKAPAFNAPDSKINVATKAHAGMGMSIKGAAHAKAAELARVTTHAPASAYARSQFGSNAGGSKYAPSQATSCNNTGYGDERADPLHIKNQLDDLTKAVDSSIALFAEANGKDTVKSKAARPAFRKKMKVLEGIRRERRTVQKLKARVKKLDQELTMLDEVMDN